MDERLRRRIIMFYAAGIVNAFLGLFILFEGPKYVPQETANWMVIFFLTFAAVDFYFPYAIKKKWEEEQARRRAAQSGGSTEVRGKK